MDGTREGKYGSLLINPKLLESSGAELLTRKFGTPQICSRQNRINYINLINTKRNHPRFLWIYPRTSVESGMTLYPTEITIICIRMLHPPTQL